MADGLVLGVVIGFSAGISPGPLLTLVVLASAKGGFTAGWRVAVAPLLTDVVIVVLAITALGALPEGVLGAIGLVGACLVGLIGVRTVLSSRTAEPVAAGEREVSGVFRQAAVVNLLSPHPWLFWATVGAPIVLTSWREEPSRAIAFVLGFYLLLVGSKAALAGLVGGGRRLLAPRAYRLTVLCCGLAMAVFAVVLAAESLPAARDLFR
ncbi:LysE family translocator [Saccharothrix coeruleofusca]|uniref:Threonine/homoserine/homoserine lactone efflux protein n=1 Tax=Saccharothrix coeruleofusca TaxID=33919 RepID=A0A918ATH0_9PSEU|nr:LysE family transporter [Saccharothrix coeruleofusca]MBP2336901.1 threonine/homoserine/homoserine lactone efflux protein [Saccharothrix coeruleofusca]GGP82008.1 hypothetical protein GCM10010185_65080 [Saccharothrix coeruleofusca]